LHPKKILFPNEIIDLEIVITERYEHPEKQSLQIPKMEFRILNNQRRLNFSKHLFGKIVTTL
jgi:hypothetical protein